RTGPVREDRRTPPLEHLHQARRRHPHRCRRLRVRAPSGPAGHPAPARCRRRPRSLEPTPAWAAGVAWSTMASLRVVLERETVLAGLHALYDAMADGEGRLVLLTGEAGIGKTTVARLLAEQVAGPTWWGQCDPLTSPRPLSPLLDIVDDPSTALPDVVRRTSEPYDVFARLVVVLRDLPHPVLIVLEDIHWADGATLD